MSADPEVARPTKHPIRAKDGAVAVDQKAGTQAAGQVSVRKESTRSWASRRAVGPSWLEKIEQF